MEDELERIKSKIRNKRHYPTIKEERTQKIPSWLFHFLSKLGITALITLVALITLKGNSHFKTEFYKQVYETNFSFAYFNTLYQKYFGSPLPFQDLLGINTKPVFQETLKYSESSLYKDGVKLTVEDNYLVPIKETGLVIFIGEKEDYGQVVIVQQNNGIELWYGNMNTVNVKLYDYVEKGSLLGEVRDTSLYLVYKQDGKVLDYHEFI